MRNFIVIVFAFATLTTHAQRKKTTTPVVKQPLSHLVYNSWKDISGKIISPDGNYAGLIINPQEGDGKVVFYHLANSVEDSVSRAADLQITYDSKWAVFKIKPQLQKVKELRRQKKKKDDLPKDSLGIYSFATRRTEKIADVRSYKMPEKEGGWLAYQLEPVKESKPKAPSSPDKKEEKPKKKKVNNDDNGYTLVIRDLATRQELSFGFVKEYAFAKGAQGLLFTSTGNDSTLQAGVYWYHLPTQKLQTLFEGKPKHKVKGLAISEQGEQVAFLVDTDTTKALIRNFQLYHANVSGTTTKVAETGTPGVTTGWTVSEHATPYFAKNGKRLFFGAAPKPLVQDTTLLPEEIVQVEVWHWNDDLIYPQQSRRADSEKKRPYLCTYDIASQRIVQAHMPEVPSIEVGDEGNAAYALGESNLPYRHMIVYDPSAYIDLYLINLQDGSRKQIAQQVKGNASLSPRANFVTWFSLTDTSWFSYAIATGQTVRLNQGLSQQFADEENDVPDYPSAYGVAGWTKDDGALLVYDRYDIWSFDPQNKREPVNVTKIGRDQKIVFRYIRLNDEERFIDPEQDLLLSAFNQTTKASGYYKLNLSSGKLMPLVMDNYRFNGTLKAKLADQLLFTRESFREFPDVWLADFNFKKLRKLSNANPQMKNYQWGTVELVSWTSLDNVPLQGLLYKPENFDPAKKYPMIVYFYEKESDNIHRHTKPEPLRSTINRTAYVSDGYLVFVPDIVYKTGFPGESAYNAIMPGVTALVDRGYVDERNVGIQGHSWGGYQTAYIITRTNFFKAAEAGAIVANMTSAYGGIRWETGLSRMFQYERTQSRIGGTLWQKPVHFIENSPLFFVEKIETPLLLLHNDADGHVPWYQGIEMYMAMRRLNKPVWMLNYNGEPHWPVKRENRMDFQIRMKQFFDHYLKGAPAPQWMSSGIPATEKGINKGY